MTLYPLKFTPIFKEKIWGGDKLKTILNKDIPSNLTGESWEISGIEGDESQVANGPLIGLSLSALIAEYKEKLVGEKIYKQFGNEFPLLIKFIDANDDLSVQVHPDDKVAAERHQSFGKTEMWYVCEADVNAQLVAGFKEKSSKDEMIKHLEQGTVEDLLNFEAVKPNEAFFIPSGSVHAIGKGILLAEIQQTSDLTYRIYDYNRTDSDGNLRDLHIAEAIDVINYTGNDNCRIRQEDKPERQLVNCEYFTTHALEITGQTDRDYTEIDSFVVYMCTEGRVRLEYSTGEYMTIEKGESVLLPPIFNKVKINSQTNSKLLEVYIK